MKKAMRWKYGERRKRKKKQKKGENMKNAKRAVGKGSYCAGTDARSHD